MKRITNKFEALCAALEMAILAPNDAKSQQCVALCDALASGMNVTEVERAKRVVLKRLNAKDN